MAHYGKDYFMSGVGSCYQNFQYMPELSNKRATAFAAAAAIAPGATVLDYGCGMGSLTAGLLNLGYDATGVDVSQWAVDNCFERVKGAVHMLDEHGLGVYKDDQFDAVIAKDVFEHIAEQALPALIDEMLRIAPRLLFLVPVCDKNRLFLRPSDEMDETYITRLTKQEWIKLTDYEVQERAEVPAQIKADNGYGSFCGLIIRPD